MRRHNIFAISLFLIPISVLAQQVNWESMERPYFVKSATGTAVGWYEGTQHSYMIASNLAETLAYVTTVDGAEDWPDRDYFEVIHGASRVSACRTADGRRAAAIVPWYGYLYPDPFQRGVHFTTNGGQSWTYNPDDGYYPAEQPPILPLVCIGVHPNSPDFAVAGGLAQPYPDGGFNWSVPFQNPDIWGACHSIEFARLTEPGLEYDAYFAFNSLGSDNLYHWVVRKNYDIGVAPVELPVSGRIPGDRRAISVAVDPNVPSGVFVGCQNMFYYSNDAGETFHERPGVFPVPANEQAISGNHKP
jgi:hypothetical protein